MTRVLVVRLSSLGDIVLTYPSLRHLESTGHEVHVLTKETFRPLVEILSSSIKVHTLPNHATFAELSTKVEELKLLNFSHIYDLHRNLRSLIIASKMALPVSRIKKYRFKELFLFIFRRRLFNLLFKRPIDRRSEALRAVGGQVQGVESGGRVKDVPTTPVLGVVEDWAQRFGHRGFVCISAESAWRQKEWPQERFIAVAREVVRAGYGVAWMGLRQIPQDAKIEGTLDLTGKLKLPEAAAVLSRAKLLVCNDSGLMHLAEAAGTPVVAIFGPTSRELGFAPAHKQSFVVEKDLWCRPCSKTGRLCIRPIERRKCLKIVEVADVLNGIWSRINQGAQT